MGGATGLEFSSPLHARLLVTVASIREWLVLASVSLWDPAVSLYAEKGDATGLEFLSQASLDAEEKGNANPRAASLHLLVFERPRDSWATVCPPFFHPSMALLSISPLEGQV